MLPVEGTDVHVSRCSSISSGEQMFKNISTSKSIVLQEEGKGAISISQMSVAGEQEERAWCCFLIEESHLLQ